MEQIHGNLVNLATWADYQPNSRFVLREQRELIQDSDLQRWTEANNDNPYCDQVEDNQNKPVVPRQKQVKHPWTPEEQDLFLKALKEYGPKSKFYPFSLTFCRFETNF